MGSRWTPGDVVALRKERGWTQEDLARHSGLSVDTIAALERGRRKIQRYHAVLFESLKKPGPLPEK